MFAALIVAAILVFGLILPALDFVLAPLFAALIVLLLGALFGAELLPPARIEPAAKALLNVEPPSTASKETPLR